MVPLVSFASQPAQAASCGTGGVARCTLGSLNGLDVKKFADDIANGIEAKKPVGYAVAVVDRDGNNVLELSAGHAVRPADPIFTIQFDINARSDIGSVSKVITEAIVRHGIEMTEDLPAYSSCKVHLDTKFLDVLPSVFAEVDTSGYYDDVTIQQVLGHKAGVPNNLGADPYGNPYDYWITMRRPDGYRNCEKGSYCYSNDNYVLATMMVGMIFSCGAKPSWDGLLAAMCAGKPAGREEQTCQIQNAYTLLAGLSNETVRDMIMSPFDVSASCDYQTDFLDAGIPVAKGYTDRNDPHGDYAWLDVRGCGVGQWHMSARSLAKVMRYLHQGTFFFHKQSADALPDTFNGGHDNFVSRIQNLDSLQVAFESNTPISQTEVGAIISSAYQNARVNGTVIGTSPPVLDQVRGAWDCKRSGSSATMRLQVASRNDIRGYHLADFGGEGSNELWSYSSNGSSSASGTYVYYKTTSNPREDQTWSGTWKLSRQSNGTLRVTRRDDATGWTGDYTCQSGTP
ncbi:MAG: serine hydrolase [Myxococcota bacterium]